MAIANYFYHSLTRKYISIFGNVFNKMVIIRKDDHGFEQKMIVPIAYGPYQKWLSKKTQDKDFNRKALVTQPRMSFEMTGITYDSARNLPSLNRIKSETDYVYVPAPYNIDFTLTILCEYADDGTQIVEQIMPHFKPVYSVTAKMIDEIEALDIPISLTSISHEDTYDGAFETRQTIIWTLTFTMKAWYFGPTRQSKIIKFIDIDVGGKERVTTPNL